MGNLMVVELGKILQKGIHGKNVKIRIKRLQRIETREMRQKTPGLRDPNEEKL